MTSFLKLNCNLHFRKAVFYANSHVSHHRCPNETGQNWKYHDFGTDTWHKAGDGLEVKCTDQRLCEMDPDYEQGPHEKRQAFPGETTT